MTRLIALMCCLPLLGAAPSPRRIVSLNLCADQYLMALADPGQIAAVTVLARDPAMSAGVARAASLPVTRGGVEAVLALRPDLLLAAPGGRRDAVALLRGRDLPVLDVSPADSYAAIVAQVRAVAAAIGHPARGERLVAAMDARLARLDRRAGRGRVAAYYQRRGYLTGTGTLVDELMGRVGLANLAARQGAAGLARLSVEQMVAARPDLLVVETDSEQVVDQGTEMLRHPALATIPRLRLPQAWTVCGGPAYVRAAESLAAQLRAQR